MKITMPPQVHTALELLSKHGFEGFAVGGCVRDSLLGRVPDDWDITTNAEPAQMQRVFSDYKIIETGVQHGTLTVFVDGMPLEITTYRIDGAYADARHPTQVSFSRNLADDLARRDFTVNAMCYNEERGLVDLYGGVEDLSARVLRCVGDPDGRFTEDALRILRALRFASVLGFSIEENTARGVLAHRELLSRIAAERIQTEFVKLLCGQNVTAVLRQFHPVLAVFLPQLSALVGCTQPTPYHKYDVFEHTLRTLDAIAPDAVGRLVMFFHDFGKPAVKTTDANGIAHFKGHAVFSAEIADQALRQLRFDTKTRATVTQLVRVHDLKSAVDKVTAKRYLRALGPEGYLRLIQIKRADCRAKANPHANDDKLKTMKALYDEILRNGECYTLKQLAVDGNILKNAGVTDGIVIRETLNFLLDAVIEERCPNEKTALLQYRREHEIG